MRTRAQRKKEEDVLQTKTADAGRKKNKKQLLEEKNEQMDAAAAGKGEGKKKVKDEPAPPQRTRRAKAEEVRVSDKVQSPKRTRNRTKQSPNPKKNEEKKDASVEKKVEEASRSRKKASDVKNEPAKDAEDSKSKIPAKGDSNGKKQEAKEEIKTIKFKGKVPLDEHCGFNTSTHHVLEHGGKVYSATLNQTKVASNNNKYYILQCIQQDSNANNCYFFTRWGRVGVRGQTSREGPYSLPTAIRSYEAKYHEKCRKGDYQEIELNFEADKSENNDDKNNDDKSNQPNPEKEAQKVFEESQLPTPLKKLIELIFDVKMMTNHMTQIGYNVKKMPLGNLTKAHIQKGYNVLKKLMDELKGRNDRHNIEAFTNDFYTNIPHDFGFSKMSNFILDSEKKVKEKIEMLEALAEIKVATALIEEAKEADNVLDSNYKKLNRTIQPITRGTNEFQLIDQYLQTTHATTHNSYTLQLVDLFSLRSEAEEVRFTKDIDNRMLLWHGSRLTNFVGILSQGLRIAPPEAPVTGYMFGKGVYFADMSSKSANYCFTNRQSSTGILLLCEVALGGINEKFNADYYAGNLPPGKHSTKGVGRTAPDPARAVTMEDGVVIPMGPGEPTALACTLLYNEFIVYDIAQIKIRYLLRTKFNYP